jgi:uncharacterized membrane protein YfcA
LKQEPPADTTATDDRLERVLVWLDSVLGSVVIALFSTLIQLWRGSREVDQSVTLALCFVLSFIGAEVGRRIETRFLGSKALKVRGLEVLRLFIPVVVLSVLLRQVLQAIHSSPEILEASFGLIRGLFIRGALVYTKRWGNPED